MTENKTNLFIDDDELLRSFFADNKMEELPDEGFSERVMQQLPSAGISRIYHLWSLLCFIIGIICFIATKGWKCLPTTNLPHITIDFNMLQYTPMIVGAYLKAILSSQAALSYASVILMSMMVLGCVWVYNEFADRHKMSY